ncbi:MAG: NUDIX hydrolase [Gammaproteobacteria bacterium]|nr:NUDIX hydrolase [Gammaproteobacteria bacterium]
MREGCLLTLALIVCAAASADHDRVKAAGCYIATERGVVMTIGRFNGELQLPAGTREPGESPACTARRETLEETGLIVQVAERVGARKGGRFVLFRCIPEKRLDVAGDFKPLDFFEIREVLVLNPSTLLDVDGVRIERPWRFPQDRPLLTALFSAGEPAAPEIRAGLDCAGGQRDAG